MFVYFGDIFFLNVFGVLFVSGRDFTKICWRMSENVP